VIRTCAVHDLIPFDMVLEQELRTKGGLLVVAKGQEVTAALILRLKSFLEYGAIDDMVTVSAPVHEAMTTTA
jgi:hypothetical protein